MSSSTHEQHVAVATKRIVDVIREGVSNQEVMQTYRDWATNYDQEVLYEEVKYRGPRQAADEIIRLYSDNKDARILDVCAGTGLMGRYLTEAGFTNIDALDGTSEMLEEAKKKNVYQNYIMQFLGKERINLDDDVYDAIMTCGCWHYGHVETADCLPELARVVKPGGKIVFIMDEEDLNKRYKPTMQQMESQGKWKLLEEREFESYCLGTQGMVLIFLVC